MPIIFASPGSYLDFEGNGGGVFTQYAHPLYVRQEINPCSILGGSLGNPVALYKNVPASNEYYVSAFLDIVGTSTTSGQIFSFRDSSDTNLLLVYIDGTSKKIYVADAIGAQLTPLGTTVFTTGVKAHVEFYAKIGATDGAIKVWVDGNLEIDFTGNTGSANITKMRLYAESLYHVSEYVISTERITPDIRICNTIPTNVIDANDACDWAGVGSLGPNIAGSSQTTTGFMFLIAEPAKADLSLSRVAVYGKAAGTIKLVVLDKDPSSNTFTTAYATPEITITAGAWNYLYPTTNFDPITVNAGQYFGIYGGTGAIGIQTANNNLHYGHAGYYNKTGDYSAVGASASYTLTDWVGNNRWDISMLVSGDVIGGDPMNAGCNELSQLSEDFNDVYATTDGQIMLRKLFADDIKRLSVGSIEMVGIGSQAAIVGTPIVSKIAHFVKSGSTESVEVLTALSTTKKGCFVSFPVNPATGLKWNNTDLLNLQIGTRARS